MAIRLMYRLFCLFVRFGSFIPFPEVSADLQRYTALKNLPKTHVQSLVCREN